MKKFIPLLMPPCLFFFWLGWSFGPSDERIVEKEVLKKVIVEIPKELKREDFKKRDEVAKAYYEKAFSLFLANLGLQLTFKDQKSLERLIQNPQEYLARPPKPREEATIQKKTEIKDSTYIENNFVGQELSHLPDLLNQKAGAKILKEPNMFFARSQYIQDFTKLKQYLGVYKGSLYLTQGSSAGKVHQVYMNIDFNIKDNNEIDGKFSLQLFNGEKVYSDSNGTGGNRDVRMIQDELIIEVGPGWFFLFKDAELKVGQYYRDGKYSGLVELNKE